MTLRYDLRINQGETRKISIPVFDTDGNGNPALLAGVVAKGQVRSHASSPTVLYEWSTANGNVTYDSNNVVLTVPAAESTLWSFRTGQWSLELSDNSGATTRLVEGMVIVHPEVVRP